MADPATTDPPKRKRAPYLPEGLREAKRRKEVALADLRQLEVDRRRAKLLDADEVERTWSSLCRDFRAAILAVPSRVRARLPQLTVEELAVVDEELRAALTALADEQGATNAGPH